MTATIQSAAMNAITSNLQADASLANSLTTIAGVIRSTPTSAENALRDLVGAIAEQTHRLESTLADSLATLDCHAQQMNGFALSVTFRLELPAAQLPALPAPVELPDSPNCLHCLAVTNEVSGLCLRCQREASETQSEPVNRIEKHLANGHTDAADPDYRRFEEWVETEAAPATEQTQTATATLPTEEPTLRTHHNTAATPDTIKEVVSSFADATPETHQGMVALLTTPEPTTQEIVAPAANQTAHAVKDDETETKLLREDVARVEAAEAIEAAYVAEQTRLVEDDRQNRTPDSELSHFEREDVPEEVERNNPPVPEPAKPKKARGGRSKKTK